MSQKVVLVSAGVLTEFRELAHLEPASRDEASIPHVGYLVVASLLRQLGRLCGIVDSDAYYRRHLESGREASDFSHHLAAHLALEDAHWIGFSTLCNSFPLTLRIVREVRRLRPDLPILLGGPQVTTCREATLRHFPEVTAVLGGEVDESLALFLEHYPDRPREVPGLAWRDAQGTVHSNPLPPPVPMDRIPPPAFDLLGISSIPTGPVEAGRGCPFHCRFCSTSTFFQRSFRVRPISDIQEEATRLVQQYGASRVVLIHDNFGVNRPYLEKFCRSWMDHPVLRTVPWTCSLRPSSVDEDLAQLLAQAGCSGVFVGLETGSPRMQRVVGKNLDLDRSWRGILALDHAGIETTVSFITGFPEETPEDQEQTVQWFHRVLRTRKAQAQIQTLSPLPGSDYHKAHANELELSHLHSSMVQQALALPAAEREWLAAYPDLFVAHYSFPLRHLSTRENQALCGFLRTAPKAYGIALLAAADLCGGLMPLFQRWWRYSGNAQEDQPAAEPRYYFTSDFRSQLGELLLSVALEPDLPEGAGILLRSLTMLYRNLSAQLSRWPDVLARCADSPSEVSLDTTLVPRCLTLPFDYDLDTVDEHLRNGRALDSLQPSPCTLLVTEEFGQSRRLQQAGPLTAAILTCLGEGLTLGELLERLQLHPLAQRPPASPEAVIAYAVTVLLQEGTIGVQKQTESTSEA